MKISLPGQFALLAFVIAGIGILVISYYSYRDAGSLLREQSMDSMAVELQRLNSNFRQNINEMQADVHRFAISEPVSGYERALAAGGYDEERNMTQELWRQQLATEFTFLLEQRPNYLQARYIGIANGGVEIVRVEHQGEEIIVTPVEELQAKGKRDYFLHTIKLGPGQQLVTRIELNREHGDIVYPLQPTLRVAAPVYNTQGNVTGIIVINVDFDMVAAPFMRSSPGVTFMLADETGDYVLHPDSDRRFTGALRGLTGLRRDFPGFDSSYSIDDDYGFFDIPEQSASLVYTRLHYTPSIPACYLAAIALVSHEVIEARSLGFGQRLLIGVLVVVLLLSISMALLAKRLLNPISQLTAASDRIAGGEEFEFPITDRSDELGILARSFKSMLNNLKISRQQLEKALVEAQSSSLAKSAFLANMSHEIRTPMNAIIGLTHLLKRASPSPEQSVQLNKIDTAADHLLTIINDILDLSMIEAGNAVLEESNFRLDDLFQQVINMMQGQIDTKGLALKVDQQTVPNRLYGDAPRLRQALLNYLSNAVKFTERGSISLRSILLDEHGDELMVRFEVDDTGIGIDADELSRLFTPFEQLDASLARKYEGSGLGLIINKRLAQLMGGEVGVDSKLGLGSTFWLTARFRRGHGVENVPTPFAEGKISPAADLPESEAVLRGHHAGSHILLVEDNAINREVAVELLMGANLIVDTAADGRIAVEKVKSGSYDLILMDIQMPGMDGLEATRLIRDMDGGQDLPILAMTANIFEDDRLACLEVGMNGFVAKPVYPEDLYSVLIKWLPAKEGSDIASSSEAVQVSHSGKKSETASDDGALISQLNTIEGLDIKKGLRNLRNDPKSLLRLMRQLDTTHGKDMKAVEVHLESGDRQLARGIAHALKGAGGTLGLWQIYEAATELDQQLRRGSDTNRELQLIKMVSVAQHQLHEALAGIAEPIPAVTGEIDPAEARRLMNQLRTLLADDDSKASELFLESEAMLRQVFGPDVDLLEQQINAFDYPSAVATIESILTEISQ